jgi:hypothetical protein
MTAPKLAPVQAPGALPMPRASLTAGVDLDPATERERESRMEDLKTELSRMLADGKGHELCALTMQRLRCRGQSVSACTAACTTFRPLVSSSP